MSEKRIQFEIVERLSLENIMLKEELLKRDWAKVTEAKETLTKELLKKYGVDPSKQDFGIDLNGIVVKDKTN